MAARSSRTPPPPPGEAGEATFDGGALEDLDPSTSDGYRVIYDREVPFELRVEDSTDGSQQVGSFEAVKVKILLLGDDGNPQAIRVEVSSEADLFFHFMHVLDEGAFQAVQEQQRLTVEFHDYANVLIHMLNNCIQDPQQYTAVFVMQQGPNARLDFVSNAQFRFIDLLSAAFARSSDEVIQHQISYRYSAMKARLQLMTGRLQELQNLVKVKNPSLLMQLKGSAGAGAVRGATTPSSGRRGR